MISHVDGHIGDVPTAHTVTFFPPVRPTEGNTVYVLPDSTSTSDTEGEAEQLRH